MSKQPMPEGLIPGLGWVIETTRHYFHGELDETVTEELDEAVVALEEELLDLEPVLEEEPSDSPFHLLQTLCTETLEQILLAWDEECEDLLDAASHSLSRAYLQLATAQHQTLESQVLCTSA